MQVKGCVVDFCMPIRQLWYQRQGAIILNLQASDRWMKLNRTSKSVWQTNALQCWSIKATVSHSHSWRCNSRRLSRWRPLVLRMVIESRVDHQQEAIKCHWRRHRLVWYMLSKTKGVWYRWDLLTPRLGQHRAKPVSNAWPTFKTKWCNRTLTVAVPSVGLSQGTENRWFKQHKVQVLCRREQNLKCPKDSIRTITTMLREVECQWVQI